MLPSAVDELFADYAAALARGERPRARDYLDRAGADADELATMIERFLQAAPRPVATAEDSALLAGWLQHEPPLLELRRRQGLKRGDGRRLAARPARARGAQPGPARRRLPRARDRPARPGRRRRERLERPHRDPEGERPRARRLATAAARGDGGVPPFGNPSTA